MSFLDSTFICPAVARAEARAGPFRPSPGPASAGPLRYSFKEFQPTNTIASHFHVLKYDTNGEVVWQHHLSGTPHLGAGANAIALMRIGPDGYIDAATEIDHATTSPASSMRLLPGAPESYGQILQRTPDRRQGPSHENL